MPIKGDFCRYIFPVSGYADALPMAKLTKPAAPPADARQKRVVMLGLSPVNALDVIGMAEVFAWANQMAGGGMAPYVLELVCSSPEMHLESETGIGLKGHSTLEQECRSNKPIDTLLVAASLYLPVRWLVALKARRRDIGWLKYF